MESRWCRSVNTNESLTPSVSLFLPEINYTARDTGNVLFRDVEHGSTLFTNEKATVMELFCLMCFHVLAGSVSLNSI